MLHDQLDTWLIRRLTDRARSEGLSSTGAGGLLRQLAELVLEDELDGSGRPPGLVLPRL
ncbi:hypothetical protein ACFYWN_42140 [Streptomyces sp. NPDC002917]|uniref:hypothetical protein n=1 Tax=unclassified Streptomyces TaxID=2593676 RepID=UPI002E81147B|nr:hypothetical protein [Streptomyces sp. NBC_00562]WTD37353.1 hypothetical protein OHB03_36930 [Streptomyces sp. NBC_01643]WUC23816.1 hypothetical protein OHA33_35950 [Streptomyces sp. NBC_00562]